MPSLSASSVRGASAGWLPALRTYVALSLSANLAWEIAQLPLYTIWRSGTAGEIAFAVLHCTAGDLVIAICTLVLALAIAGRRGWPLDTFVQVLSVTMALGVGYTAYSERLNVIVRKSWAYSDLMPVVPFAEVGLSPLLQWIVIPVVALFAARRRACKDAALPD